MTVWAQFTAGGFAHVRAPFAAYRSDQQRARHYRNAARGAGFSWEEVLSHVIGYGNMQGRSQAKLAEETARVRKM